MLGVAGSAGSAATHPAAHLLTAGTRDEGDGSSSSTNNDESEISGSNLVEVSFYADFFQCFIGGFFPFYSYLR